MRNTLATCSRLAATIAVWAFAGSSTLQAQTANLKFAFISNETEETYVTAIKPFIAAVNRDREDIVHIDCVPNALLSRNFQQPPQLVPDGLADIAFAVPALPPGRFPDN